VQLHKQGNEVGISLPHCEEDMMSGCAITEACMVFHRPHPAVTLGWAPALGWRCNIPSLVKMRSAMEMTADSAGTGQPIWARTTAQHAARSNVDLPPMFGPVSSIVWGAVVVLHSMC